VTYYSIINIQDLDALIKNYHEEFSTLADKVSYVFIGQYLVNLTFSIHGQGPLRQAEEFLWMYFCVIMFPIVTWVRA